MARVTICDRCGTKDDVQAGDFDLCGPCAWKALDRLARSDVPGVREAVLAEASSTAGSGASGPPISTAIVSDEARATQRRAALFVEHGTKIFDIIPTYAIKKLPQQMKYGPKGEESTVEVLEAIPGQPGKYFAKIVI